MASGAELFLSISNVSKVRESLLLGDAYGIPCHRETARAFGGQDVPSHPAELYKMTRMCVMTLTLNSSAQHRSSGSTHRKAMAFADVRK